ncbi:sensor histidine kinase [Candidatus Nitrosocosmicus arcticus]|uniref:Putative signal transduction histidine kinase with phosphoacceptor and ATP binding domain n=1 Tax=Candidatus Nitrosocosmicus arcticus TaxID=2035267 RepID=A0A557STR9_9ARCH|nr:HAMP domain-containing sensor histidine kinase [Candidatus Nitrosocosmicus arcticus]TVP39999.1 putative signal transduction histidine kinase with phosphoacceptor and ATP binding domain [Candidatus Nitrosocosmicus arcticus]
MTISEQTTLRNRKTDLIYNMDTAVNYGIRFLENVRERLDVCVDKNGPSVIMKSNIYKSNYVKAKNRGAKIRFVTEITKDNIQYCKELSEIVSELRHLDGIKGSVCVNDSEFLGMTTWSERQLLSPVIYSTEREVIEQQRYIFEMFWKKAEPFTQKLKEIEEGIVPEIMQSRNSPVDIQNRVLDLLKSAESEILIIMSTSNAFHRQAKSGSFQTLKELGDSKPWIKIKILTPKDDEIEKLIIILNKPNFAARFIEPLSKVSILVIDRKQSLVAETKDDTRQIITEAIGFVTYSNSAPTVLSYVAIFDSIWKQTEIYQQLKEAHEKLKIHDKMQKEFINIVAHDLRTPLTPIIGLTEYVRDKTKDVHHMELLDRVVKDAKKLSYLNEKILDVTKFESKLFKPNKEVFSLNELIVNVIKELEHILDDTKKIKFEYHFDTEYLVYADSRRTGQVISNLIDNSIKSISEQETGRGVISIDIERTNNTITTARDDCDPQYMVIVIIKDTGIALDNEILPRLFTKFATKSFQGTGLGLYLSKNIIEAHGGRIWAENNKDGIGATVSFTLPLTNKVI